MVKEKDLTYEQLIETFRYDPEDKTRVFIRIKTDKRGYKHLGKRSGCITAQGYVHVAVKCVTYKLHRLVYMYKYKVDYKDVPIAVDHINRDVLDNRIENIRDGSFAEDLTYINGINRVSIGNSKYIGVGLADSLRNKFQTSITINNRETSLYRYKSEIACAEVYKAACKYLGYEVDECYNDIEDIDLPQNIIDIIENAKTLEQKEMKHTDYNGVSWSREKQMWVARINIYEGTKSKVLSVGYYDDDLINHCEGLQEVK